MFIVIEGVDGVGKTSVSMCVAELLGIKYYKSPDRPFVEAKAFIEDNYNPRSRYYFYRSVVQHDSENIQKLLTDGASIICDRYSQSLYAYHVAMDSSINEIFELNNILVPDLEILLLASKSIRLKRLSHRSAEGDRLTKMDKRQNFLDDVQKIFKNRNMHQIDTSNKSIEHVAAVIVDMVRKLKLQ